MVEVQALAAMTLGEAERSSVEAELRRATEVIRPDEAIQMLAVGDCEGIGNSLLILTDKRLVMLNETGWFNKTLKQREVAWPDVLRVKLESGWHGELEIDTTSGEIEIERVRPSARAAEIANYIRSQIPTPPPAAAAAGDPLDQLRKLAELRDAGIVSPEEFEAKKAEILARM